MHPEGAFFWENPKTEVDPRSLGPRCIKGTDESTPGKDSIKDGAYYCYCAYVLRILRYLGFLSVMLTNTGTFLHGLKISGKSRSY